MSRSLARTRRPGASVAASSTAIADPPPNPNRRTPMPPKVHPPPPLSTARRDRAVVRVLRWPARPPMRLEEVPMRGRCDPPLSMLAFVDLDARIPTDHPLRIIKRLADSALVELSPIFDRMYAAGGRPSIPPERLLKANLLIALYSIRSERAFCEELDYHLLYRWFLGMNMLDPSFDASTFAKNRERLLRHEVAQRFFDEVVFQADRLGLLSDEHFTVDGTLIEAAASLKSFRRRDGALPAQPVDDPGNPTVDFRGERRSNATHARTTDPGARLLRKGKGKEAKP